MLDVSRVVEACFNSLTEMNNLKPVTYEDEWSFSLLDLCTPGKEIGTSSR